MTDGKKWGMLLLGAVIIVACYSRVVSCGFLLYDDPDYVTANQHIFDGFTPQTIRWAFTAGHSANWHPVTWLSHALDVRLYWFNPAGHHFTSLLLHSANYLLLATLLWRLTGAFGRSLTVGLLFALHPLHVEPVAWIAERKEVLSAFFWFVTLHGYVSFARRGGGVRLILTAGVFFLGLMAKPMVVTLPVVLFLLDYWPLGRLPQVPLRRLIMEKVPLLAGAAAVSAVTVAVQKHWGAVDLRPEALPVNAGNALVSYVAYLGKTFWPARLSFTYPYHPEAVTLPAVAGAALVLAAVSAAVFSLRQHRFLVVGWLWYLVTLLPVIGFIHVGDQAMADRYTYLPLTGIFIMAVWGGWKVVAGSSGEKWLAGAAALVLLVLGVLTWRQTGYWRDGLSLNRHALEVTERNWVAHYNLAGELTERGDAEGAMAHYREAIRLFPGYERSYYNLAKILLSLGRTEEGIRELTAAVTVDPSYREARQYLGFVWLRLGRQDLASAEYRRLLHLDPAAAASLRESITLYERTRPGEKRERPPQ